ncbi:MAG: glutamate 5-kinase [Clostridia bacterium]|nr:glutamate 5-kinase [Clostridia bacterium]
MNNIREGLNNSKRIVIKVGTSTLTYDTGKVNFTRIDKLARIISDLQNQGKQIVLVTSGAIGVGVDKLKLRERPQTIPEKQAVAAVGQCELMHIYSKFFSEYGHAVGQILLTRDVVEDENRRQNVINTFETLISQDIIPIVNENDSVSVEEIKFGENDTLSAIVAQLINADLLVILSDIDGLYDSDPRNNPEAKIIPLVEEITEELEGCAGGAGTSRGTGGMITKLYAAKLAMESNVNMVIASGKNPDIIIDIINGKQIGTLFASKKGVRV